MLEFQGKRDGGWSGSKQQLTTTETSYNIHLKRRDKRAYQNNLQLLTDKQYPSRIHPLAKRQPEDNAHEWIRLLSGYCDSRTNY